MLHCAHAHQQGLMVHATDTDVLVLAITTARALEGFETSAAHTIAAELGDDC